MISDEELILKKGNLIEGKGELLHLKKAEIVKYFKCNLKINKQKNISEGLLIENGRLYFVEFINETEINEKRKLILKGEKIKMISIFKNEIEKQFVEKTFSLWDFGGNFFIYIQLLTLHFWFEQNLLKEKKTKQNFAKSKF